MKIGLGKNYKQLDGSKLTYVVEKTAQMTEHLRLMYYKKTYRKFAAFFVILFANLYLMVLFVQLNVLMTAAFLLLLFIYFIIWLWFQIKKKTPPPLSFQCPRRQTYTTKNSYILSSWKILMFVFKIEIGD